MWRSIVDSLAGYSADGILTACALLPGLLLARRIWKHRQQRQEYRKRERLRREFWSLN
jgi:hypothetical protein